MFSAVKKADSMMFLQEETVIQKGVEKKTANVLLPYESMVLQDLKYYVQFCLPCLNKNILELGKV